MIRLFLLAAGFLSVTIALLVTQMGDQDEGTVSAEATRAGSSLFDFSDATQTPEALSQPATRRQAAEDHTPNLTRPGTSAIDMMTQSILSELRKPVTGDRLRQVASATGGESDTMRDVTNGVLNGLETATAPATQAPQSDAPQSPGALNALIVQAMREGQSDAYVDSLINEAVGTGQVQAPASLVTSSGDVDTATLLDSLVQQSFATQPEPTAAPAATLPPEGDLTYVVQPGDSLAGIALRHYGTTTAHDIIYSANRDILPTPSAVRPGMTLRIPSL